MEDTEPKICLRNAFKTNLRRSRASNESTQGTAHEDIKTQLRSHDSKDMTQRSSENEEDKEEYLCPICINSYDDIDPELIHELKVKVKELGQKKSDCLTKKFEDSVIIYFDNSDVKDLVSCASSGSKNCSDCSMDHLQNVTKKDLKNKRDQFLINFETNGVCILNNCKHIFHKCCIKNWFKDHNTCPVCREKIYEGEKILQYYSDDSSSSFENSFGLDSFSSLEAPDASHIFDSVYEVNSNMESLSVHLEEFDVRSNEDRVSNHAEEEGDFYANSDKQLSLIFTNGEQPLDDSQISESSSGSIMLEDIFTTNLNIEE